MSREMSHMGQFISDLQASESGAIEGKKKITAKVIAGRMGIDPSILSRAARGQQFAFHFPTIVKMISGISENSEIRKNFVVSLLKDILEHCPGIQPNEISITTTSKGTRLSENTLPVPKDNYESLATAARLNRLNGTMIEDLKVIFPHLSKNKHLQSTIHGLAEMVKRFTDTRKF